MAAKRTHGNELTEFSSSPKRVCDEGWTIWTKSNVEITMKLLNAATDAFVKIGDQKVKHIVVGTHDRLLNLNRIMVLLNECLLTELAVCVLSYTDTIPIDWKSNPRRQVIWSSGGYLFANGSKEYGATFGNRFEKKNLKCPIRKVILTLENIAGYFQDGSVFLFGNYHYNRGRLKTENKELQTLWADEGWESQSRQCAYVQQPALFKKIKASNITAKFVLSTCIGLSGEKYVFKDIQVCFYIKAYNIQKAWKDCCETTLSYILK